MLLTAALLTEGCASYQTPGKAADFHELGISKQEVEMRTDGDIARRLDRKPLAGFPTSLAVARVQGVEYRSRTTQGYGHGRFTIITHRDVESDQAFETLKELPLVEGVSTLNQLVLPPRLDTEEDLREAAATVQADMLLLYTFDTQFESETKVKPLGLITLGLFPDRVARVTSTASAALIDTRNGYVYGLAEGTAKRDRLSNAWNNKDSLDQARKDAERDAFDKLLASFQQTWSGVVERYATPASEQTGTTEG